MPNNIIVFLVMRYSGFFLCRGSKHVTLHAIKIAEGEVTPARSPPMKIVCYCKL
jgi:hypothetical protein